MRRKSFDSRLMAVFSVMGLLALMVSVAALGVNRYLIQSHDRLIASQIPVQELAGRIGAEAEVMAGLAAAFGVADTRAKVESTGAQLRRAARRIDQGVRQLQRTEPAPATVPEVSQIVARMSQTALSMLSAQAASDLALDRLANVAAQAEALISAQTDLARLRVTGGIADLYNRPGAPLRPRLDELADRHFFAFERLGDLARAVEVIAQDLRRVAQVSDPASLAKLRGRLDDNLDLISRRADFLPTAAAQGEMRALGGDLATALADNGALALKQTQLGLRDALATDARVLGAAVGALSDRARVAREQAQQAALAQVAQSGALSRTLSNALLIFAVLAVGAAVLVRAWARRELVDRLGNVAGRIVDVAAGDYGNPVRITRDDEIGRMEQALNILRSRAIEAAALRDNLEQAVIARTGDVVREMQQSDAARAEAEAANRAKSDFLARMSHEIRTPLNGVIGMLDLLDSGEDNPARRDRIATALASARDLLDLSNDILTFASSETRTDSGRAVHFDLRDLVGKLAAQLRTQADAKGLETVVDLSDSAPRFLLGDVVKIRQIMLNLISNAVKYTPSGRVSLAVDHAAISDTGRLAVSFAIADTGIGMSEQGVARAFDIWAPLKIAQTLALRYNTGMGWHWGCIDGADGFL